MHQRSSLSLFLERRELPIGLVLAVFFALLTQFFEFHDFYAGAEARAADLFLSARPDTLAESRVVALGIDDTDYERFFRSQSPLPAQSVVNLVSLIRTTFKPTVIGVDILTESKDYTRLSPDDIPADNGETSIVWAAAAGVPDDEDRGRQIGFGSWLMGKSGELYVKPGAVLGRPAPFETGSVNWGIPIFPREADRAIRRFPRVWHPAIGTEPAVQEAQVNVFARKIAEMECKGWQQCPALSPETEEAFLWHAAAGTEPISIGTYFACETVEPPCIKWRLASVNGPPTNLQRRVVLVGGTFQAARDSYDSSLGRQISGLRLNAEAVRVEQSGRAVQEASRWLSILGDILLGWALVFLFWKTHGGGQSVWTPRWVEWIVGVLRRFPAFVAKVLVSVGVALALVPVSYAIFVWGGFVWLSWVSMLLSSVAWQLVLDAVIDAYKGHGTVTG
jgi:hypothetical protein